MNTPTVTETQIAYTKIYKEPCSVDEAMCLVHDFIKYREFADKIEFPDDGVNFIDPKTIDEFIESRKDREIRERDHCEYKQKLRSLSPKQLWLHEEGFDNPFGLWVEKFLDTIPGCEVFDSVCAISIEPQPDELKNVLEGLLEFAKQNQPPFVENIPDVDKFLASKEANYLIGWFAGICNDGGRAFRTIHLCARAFFLHDWDTFEVLAPKDGVKEIQE